MSEAFRHADRERTIVFGAGALDAAADLFRDGYTLLTTPRAVGSAPELAERATSVVHVPAGLVDAVAADLRADVTGDHFVALGGGRVIDVAKALAAADGPRAVAAVPTSLSGAEMTGVHRHARGVADSTPKVRPSLVVNDPALSASQPDRPARRQQRERARPRDHRAGQRGVDAPCSFIRMAAASGWPIQIDHPLALAPGRIEIR
jgi:alcohol dehydrogenase class IV